MSVVGTPVQYIDQDGKVRAAIITAIEPHSAPPGFPSVQLALFEPDGHHCLPLKDIPFQLDPTARECWRNVS